MTFKINVTLDEYNNLKKCSKMTFEYVPNTATGYEDTRKYITMHGQQYIQIIGALCCVLKYDGVVRWAK